MRKAEQGALAEVRAKRQEAMEKEGNKKDFEEDLRETNRVMLKEVTPEKIGFMRFSAYGSTGAALAFLLVFLQMEQLSVALEIAVVCFAVAVPLLIFVANTSEAYLWFGPASFGHFREIHNKKNYVVFMLASYGCLAAGFLCVLFHLSVLAASLVFVISFALLVTTAEHSKILTAVVEREEANGPNK